jgi:hypothetical protein
MNILSGEEKLRQFVTRPALTKTKQCSLKYKGNNKRKNLGPSGSILVLQKKVHKKHKYG